MPARARPECLQVTPSAAIAAGQGTPGNFELKYVGKEIRHFCGTASPAERDCKAWDHDPLAVVQRIRRIVQQSRPRRVPEHQQLLLAAARPSRDQRLEDRVQPRTPGTHRSATRRQPTTLELAPINWKPTTHTAPGPNNRGRANVRLSKLTTAHLEGGPSGTARRDSPVATHPTHNFHRRVQAQRFEGRRGRPQSWFLTIFAVRLGRSIGGR